MIISIITQLHVVKNNIQLETSFIQDFQNGMIKGLGILDVNGLHIDPIFDRHLMYKYKARYYG